MATCIAANAWIDPQAEIDTDVEIGPFCTIGPQVKIHSGTRLVSSVAVMGKVTLGRNNEIYPNAVIGGEPQDLSYTGSNTQVIVGDGNIIRESVTINRGSEKEDGITFIGSNNMLMAGSHVAHDCKLGDHIVMANCALLGGHVHVEDYASISGAVGVHHYATIGSYSFVGGLSRVLHDVPPFMLCEGAPARPRCINIVALKRHNFTSQVIDCLAEAHRLIYRGKIGLEPAREILRGNGQLVPEVNSLLMFVSSQQDGRHGRSREGRKAA
jgi:UDP-N-acetylglucosamine acyltransferase